MQDRHGCEGLSVRSRRRMVKLVPKHMPVKFRVVRRPRARRAMVWLHTFAEVGGLPFVHAGSLYGHLKTGLGRRQAARRPSIYSPAGRHGGARPGRGRAFGARRGNALQVRIRPAPDLDSSGHIAHGHSTRRVAISFTSSQPANRRSTACVVELTNVGGIRRRTH